MDISVVILTWNSARYIDRCISSLLKALAGYSCEIFIIDNGSADETVQIVNDIDRQFPGKIKPVLLERNYGTTHPRNIALKQARGRYVLIMDSDVEVSENSVTTLKQVLDSDKCAGIVAPRLVYPNGNLQKSTDDFPTVLSKIRRYFFLRAIEHKERKMQDDLHMRPVDYAISAMWLLKKELLDTVGLLDEKIFYAPEDVDYCLRVWKAGYKVIYVPEVVCVHHTQEISRGFRLNRAAIEHIKGLVYYFRKHGYWLGRPDFKRYYKFEKK